MNSRFYARWMAALVTSTGRQILQDAVTLTQSLGYDVIYGDTVCKLHASCFMLHALHYDVPFKRTGY